MDNERSRHMRKIRTIPIFAVLVLITSFSIPGAYAATLNPPVPPSGSVGDSITLSGSGFSSNTNIFVCFASTNAQETILTGFTGSFSKPFQIPPVSLGPTTISVTDNPNNCPGSLASISFTVTPPVSIPEFPFSFSLVIMFVAVAAVYLVIRQKMTTSFFKPF